MSRTAATLSRVLADRNSVQRYRGRVDLSFHGYSSDPRELYEIPEVRKFLRETGRGISLLVLFPLHGEANAGYGRILLVFCHQGQFWGMSALALKWSISCHVIIRL